ncbi:type IV pilus assembly protein PilV [Alteromonadaceae bacterium 2753L.S.0a.02]|nr:type IV pilus assembly protein PilV [Alteromonadaceae bacterium 2753L.S.0a.02]
MPITARKKQKGIGMIEVLIALLIVSVGAIGLLSTQASGKRIGYDALQRSIATGLVRDIVERMRSNPGALASYVATVGESSISTEPSPNCTTASCTPAQMAARDLWEWERALDGAGEYTNNGGQETLAGGLVTPRGCITNNNGVVTVTVAWKGYQSASNPSPGNTCGAGLYGNNDDQRQLIAITTFIEDV